MTTKPEITNQRPHYLPTPQQIAAECELIREGWSDKETQHRLGSERRCAWQVPGVVISAVCADPEGCR